MIDMSDNLAFDSFESQTEFDNYVLLREAAAVTGAIRGFAETVHSEQGASAVADGQESVYNWMLMLAMRIETIFGLADPE